MNLGEPPLFPSITLPEPLQLPAPILDIPRADIPSYTPLVVPPSDLRPPPGIEPDAKDEPPKAEPKPPPINIPQFVPPEVQKFGIPGTDIEIPVPSTEIVVTAASTAVVSVGATLVATSVFKHLVSLFKPILKQAWNKMRKKEDLSSSSSLSGPPDS
jgi:hypothetical protein